MRSEPYLTRIDINEKWLLLNWFQKANDSLLRLPYGISKRLNFPAQSLQQASRQLVGVTSHTRFTFWNKHISTKAKDHLELQYWQF